MICTSSQGSRSTVPCLFSFLPPSLPSFFPLGCNIFMYEILQRSSVYNMEKWGEGMFCPPPWCAHPVVLCLDTPTVFQMTGLPQITGGPHCSETSPCNQFCCFCFFLSGLFGFLVFCFFVLFFFLRLCKTAWKILCQIPETQKFCLENCRRMCLNFHRNRSVWPCVWLRRTRSYIPVQKPFPISDFFFFCFEIVSCYAV